MIAGTRSFNEGASMKNITCIEDLRLIHKRRVKPFFDYVDGGSYAEETLRANINDMQKFKFRQRILVDISKRELSTTILGEKAAMPLILAPIGSGGLQYMDGEIYACRAAQKVGIPYTLPPCRSARSRTLPRMSTSRSGFSSI
jgi:L-lactate dehydrogenase (cytochrome)